MNTLWGWGRASWAGCGPDVRRGGQTLIMGYSADKSPLIGHLAGPIRRLEPLGAQRQEKCGPNRLTPTGYSCNNAAAKHGGCGRRGWRKLHLGVDQSGVILVHTLTEATGEDATTGLDLLTAVDGPLVRVTADAAYDTVAVYETATARGATVIIPPAKTANISGHGPRSPARDRTITWVKTLGRRRWKNGVRVPSSGPGGECVLPLQVHHRRWPSRPESSWAGE